MPAGAFVYVAEDVLSLFNRDASLQDVRYASLIEFSVDDSIGLGASYDLSCLRFFLWELLAQHVSKDGLHPCSFHKHHVALLDL
jgi:hypothetical protein